MSITASLHLVPGYLLSFNKRYPHVFDQRDKRIAKATSQWLGK